jgi:hypothetical protein
MIFNMSVWCEGRELGQNYIKAKTKSPDKRDALAGTFPDRRRAAQSLRKFCELLVELVNTASCVHEFHLAGEEGVAVSRNLHFHERVLLAVFPRDGLFGSAARFAEEHVVSGNVFENDGAVGGRVDIFFHCTVENLLWAGRPKNSSGKSSAAAGGFQNLLRKNVEERLEQIFARAALRPRAVPRQANDALIGEAGFSFIKAREGRNATYS